jgi:hypothetical protein
VPAFHALPDLYRRVSPFFTYSTGASVVFFFKKNRFCSKMRMLKKIKRNAFDLHVRWFIVYELRTDENQSLIQAPVFLAADKTNGLLETESQRYPGKGLIPKCPPGITALGDLCPRHQGTPSYD